MDHKKLESDGYKGWIERERKLPINQPVKRGTGIIKDDPKRHRKIFDRTLAEVQDRKNTSTEDTQGYLRAFFQEEILLKLRKEMYGE